jgi:hypothetical protein
MENVIRKKAQRMVESHISMSFAPLIHTKWGDIEWASAIWPGL